MIGKFCVSEKRIVRFNRHPERQTNRKIGTQSVESREVGIVAPPERSACCNRSVGWGTKAAPQEGVL
jgi:hypothetical protein